MERSKRIFTLFVSGTLLLLLYVHEQTSILRLSYSIERKEREMVRLSENYKTAKFRVARLRSPHVLSQRMKALSLDLTLPKDQTIVRVLKIKAAPTETKAVLPLPFQLLSWLHFVKEAQAKTSSSK